MATTWLIWTSMPTWFGRQWPGPDARQRIFTDCAPSDAPGRAPRCPGRPGLDVAHHYQDLPLQAGA
eukprot:13487989-Alexandrium_andersonii.AAC.1